MSYEGDIALGQTLDVSFTTRQISGAPFTLAGSPVISAYVGNSTTQLTAGITLTVDFDGVTGYNHVRIVASGGNGYATASDYRLVITTGTVNSVSVVGEVIASFSIENRQSNVKFWNGTAVATPATAGVPEVNVKNINNVAAATPGASGGILISGSNSGTTTLGAFTVTGATTLSGAVSLGSTLGVTGTTTLAAVNTGAIGTGNVTITGTLSTSGTTTFNAFTISNALTVSGASTFTGATTYTGTVGYSNGISVIGGTNTHALLLSAAAGGDGLRSQGNTTGSGFNGIGGATGHGMKLLGGFTSGDGLNTQANGGGDGIEAVGTGAGFDINADIQGNLSGSVNSVTTGVALSAAGITAVWAEVMTGTVTAVQAMRGMLAALLGKSSGLPLAPIYRNVADTKNVIVATTDTDGNRSAVTTDLT